MGAGSTAQAFGLVPTNLGGRVEDRVGPLLRNREGGHDNPKQYSFYHIVFSIRSFCPSAIVLCMCSGTSIFVCKCKCKYRIWGGVD